MEFEMEHESIILIPFFILDILGRLAFLGIFILFMMN